MHPAISERICNSNQLLEFISSKIKPKTLLQLFLTAEIECWSAKIGILFKFVRVELKNVNFRRLKMASSNLLPRLLCLFDQRLWCHSRGLAMRHLCSSALTSISGRAHPMAAAFHAQAPSYANRAAPSIPFTSNFVFKRNSPEMRCHLI